VEIKSILKHHRTGVNVKSQADLQAKSLCQIT